MSETDMSTDLSTGGDVLLQTPTGKQRVTAVKIPVTRYTSPEFFAREMADVWPQDRGSSRAPSTTSPTPATGTSTASGTSRC